MTDPGTEATSIGSEPSSQKQTGSEPLPWPAPREAWYVVVVLMVAYLFSSLEQVREITEEWIKNYNEDPPQWQQPKPTEMSPIGVST